MSITLNDLLAWKERLPDEGSEEAHMLCAMASRRESELRAQIADLIAMVSQQENWKLHRCAAMARRVEQTSADRLESVHDYFHDRSIGRLHFGAPDVLGDPLVEETGAVPDATRSAVSAQRDEAESSNAERISALYRRMHSLESLVTPTPGMGCGIRGVRIMRLVALMSTARSARLEQMRISGTQVIYRHM
jgi:hypothetical protein